MRKIAILSAIAGVAGTLAVAAPASAAPAQCYDAYGRAIGPRYDTRYPNYNWINSVHANGGRCVRLGASRQPGIGLFFQFGSDGQDYYDRRHRYGYRGGYDYNRDYRRHRREYDYRREPGGWKFDSKEDYERNKKPNAPQQRYEITR